MAIALNADGWSTQLLRYTRNGWDRKYDKNPCIDDSYSTFGYTSKTQYNWYTKSYWNRWTMARKFKNMTDSTIILKNMSFNAAPAHSDGKYATVTTKDEDGNNLKYTFDGEGCNFYFDVFYEGKPNYDATNKVYIPDYSSSAGTMKKIYKANCHVVAGGVTYLGETDVSLRDKGISASVCSTKFGQHSTYQTAVDSKGTTLGMQKIVMNFTEGVPVKPGESVFLVVRNPVSEWTSSGSNDGGSAIECTGGSWEAIVEPTQSDYIWVMTNEGWKKARMAYKMTSSGWEVMEEV